MIYDILKSVIEGGEYRLSDMTARIDTVWAEGKLTDAQRTELHALTQSRLTPDSEAPALAAQVANLTTRMAEFETRLAALEGGGTQEEDAWPAWEPWDGVSDRYKKGAQVTHAGYRWRSTFAGQNVWEPGAAGTEALWEKVSADGAITNGKFACSILTVDKLAKGGNLRDLNI